MNKHMQRALGGLAIAGALVSGALMGTVAANAQPSVTTTVDGRDYPVCAEEDCSDQPGQIGVWVNDGRAWLSTGEVSVEVVR